MSTYTAIVIISTLGVILGLVSYLAWHLVGRLEKTENVLSDASFRLTMSKSSRLADLLQRERNRTLTERAAARAKVDDGAHIFAQRVVIDGDNSQLYVDGVRLPWWIAHPGPKVDTSADVMTVVHIPVFVDGTVEIIDGGERELTDSVLGNVADYARAKVRREMAAAFPWLEV